MIAALLTGKLVEVLDLLRDAHREWARLANDHRLDLLAHRMDAVSEGARRLDEKIEAMEPLEERRLEISLRLAAALGLERREAPPSLGELIKAAGSEHAEALTRSVGELREALQTSAALAERNRLLAESGRRVAEATVQALAQVVVRSNSTQSAYDRAGVRSRGVAVPVFQRSWKG
ncbi:MAG: hypothetical protein H6686_06500 [Fibrobacteria bacterium]|nr:hypothetical protein [Fibrobacteria bacterium]